MSTVITIKAGTQFTYIFDVQKEIVVDGVCSLEFYVESSATLTCLFAIIDAQVANINLSIVLVGSHARAIVRGIYVLDTAQHITITTRQHHQAPHTTSDLLINGILGDSAYVHYHGTIAVDQDAKKTQASQINKNILLSRAARVNSKPTLEVLTHDVRCTHGSAVGYFDEQVLLYIQSRGLTREQAQHVVLQGFFAQVVDLFSADTAYAVTHKVETMIHDKERV